MDRTGGKVTDGRKFGTAATSLALLAGLIIIAEQQKGEINHALHIAA
jgi:hypothetical protein